MKTDILAILFWKCFFCKTIQGIYILSKSSSDYFHPIIETYKKKNRIIIKYTTILYGPISEYRRNLLKSVKVNVVTSPKQAKHFKDILDIENVETQEIIIRKENYALENVLVSENFDFDFGIISRLSREKQIEHALDLIILLNRKGFRKNLFIKGEGDLEYINELNSKILTNNLTEQVVIEHIPVHPDKVIQEFPRFRCFLITSKFEGGPNIGLELMAAGKPMISYKVGAMEDRLKNFPQLLASNLEEMVEKSLKVLNAPHKEYITICKSLQEEYSNNYRNIYKEKNIIKNLGLEDLN
ncbi:glycosyltransferase [Salegentibacter sp. BDJ18]|uniref:glycosyltransferase n=1 Tax=Salegentibacter sp. BDJ18 TaxID=2816376 RepID=UPI001AAE7C4C|nr:glycosyltransferase [Salegentibacter sp. BDJ18]MBO2544278.1 glycosyltransferase [Salegentibacter sp. BDJ18]